MLNKALIEKVSTVMAEKNVLLVSALDFNPEREGRTSVKLIFIFKIALYR